MNGRQGREIPIAKTLKQGMGGGPIERIAKNGFQIRTAFTGAGPMLERLQEWGRVHKTGTGGKEKTRHANPHLDKFFRDLFNAESSAF
jgi:hypothetical protein